MCAWGTTVNKVEINVLVKFIFFLGETDNNKHNKQIRYSECLAINAIEKMKSQAG